jgi:predicted nucleic acid-binding protein
MIVLDTSFVIKLIKQEVTINIFKNDEKLITTDLLDYEFANVMWKTAQYENLSIADAKNFFEAVKTLGIERHKSDPLELFLYATKTGLTAYDASYLLLAKRYQCPVASFDKPLINMANKEGIIVVVE